MLAQFERHSMFVSLDVHVPSVAVPNSADNSLPAPLDRVRRSPLACGFVPTIARSRQLLTFRDYCGLSAPTSHIEKYCEPPP